MSLNSCNLIVPKIGSRGDGRTVLSSNVLVLAQDPSIGSCLDSVSQPVVQVPPVNGTWDGILGYSCDQGSETNNETQWTEVGGSKAYFSALEKAPPSTLNLLLVFVALHLSSQARNNWQGCHHQLLLVVLHIGEPCEVQWRTNIDNVYLEFLPPSNFCAVY